MNSCFIFVTNIPKTQRPVLLLKELDNKWARVMFIDNPVTETTDAFIYNPTSNPGHFDYSIEKLRNKEIDGIKPLKVFYVWFPPPGVFLVTMIPENAILVPYILVDHIPKKCEPFELFGDLPFKGNDVKQWDISFKEDKWLLIRLFANHDETTRNFILSYTRNKKLDDGEILRALEIIVSEEPRLSKTFVLKNSISLTSSDSYKSNFLFLYDVPSKVASHTIVDSLRHLEIRSLKVYFVDTVDEMRVGFVCLPKYMPTDKFNQVIIKIRQSEIDVNSLGKVNLTVSEVWFQPVNCLPPNNRKNTQSSRNRSRPEFILTNYLYIYNFNENVTTTDILNRAPYQIKVHIFKKQNSESQFGFVNLIEMDNLKILKTIQYLRSLVFKHQPVLVDEIWIKEYDLEPNENRRQVHLSRYVLNQSKRLSNRALENLNLISVNDDCEVPKLVLAKTPPINYLLIKTYFLFLMNLPKQFNRSTITNLNVSIEGFSIIETNNERVGFLKVCQTTQLKWLQTIDKLYNNNKSADTTSVVVKEVYSQSDETLDLIQSKLPAIYLSSYVLIYNICNIKHDWYDHLMTYLSNVNDKVDKMCHMVTEDSIRYAFVKLRMDISPQGIMECLRYIRCYKSSNSRVCAELIWLANIHCPSNSECK